MFEKTSTPDALEILVDHFAKLVFWGGGIVTAGALAGLFAGTVSGTGFLTCALASGLAATWGIMAKAADASRRRMVGLEAELRLLKSGDSK